MSPLADIEDVYAWMTGSTLNLVLDVSPGDDGSHAFDPSVQYVFHLHSKPTPDFAPTTGSETRVIVQLASNTSAQAWVVDAAGTKDYVTGDPSTTAGVTSIHGKTRLFAGRRSDPRFFSSTGLAAGLTQLGGDLNDTITYPRTAGNCPTLNASEAGLIRGKLFNGADNYAGKNVLSIVMSLDKSLVNAPNNTTVAVWASTHQGA